MSVSTPHTTAEQIDQANATGEIFLGGTRLRGRYVIRLAIGNLWTTEGDVARAWSVLKEAAHQTATSVEQA